MGAIISVLNKAGEIFCQHGVTMLVQFGLLTCLLFLADMAIRKRVKASLRYCLWCLLLVKLVLPTTLSLPTGIGQLAGVNFSINLTQTKQAEPQIQTDYMPIAVTPVQTVSEPARPTNSPQDIAESSVPKAIDALVSVKTTPLNWQGVIFIFWIAGVVLLLAGFLRRIASIQKLIAESEAAPERLTDMVRMCREKMGVRGEVQLRLSDNIASPAVCGLFRHVILVPTGLLEKMDRSKLAMVLMHELSHVKRADLWVNMLQTILQILYFYNPFVWAANAYIRRVREQAVDEMVLTRLNCAAASYSNTLIDVAEKAFSQPRFSMATVSIIESKSKLKERIKIMLGKPIPKNTKIGFAGLLLLIVVAAVMLPMAKATPPREFVIKGTVSDAQTGKPIVGAKVGDTERYADGKYGTVTDSNGNYSYKTWYEEHDVKCEAAGYKTETKVLLTKMLGSEQEKIIDFTLGSKGASGDIDYANATIKEGVGFDGFIAGDANCTGEFIKNKLGEPEKESKTEKEGWWLVYHKRYGLDFWLNLPGNTLQEIRLNEGFKGKLTSGISMSSTKEEVFAAYGKPIWEETADDFDKRFDDKVLLLRKPSWLKEAMAKIYYDDKGLLFWFDKKDKIHQIVVYRPGSNKECSENKFKVTLSNDMTIELVAICDYPDGKPRSWRPDGSKLEKQIYIKREGMYQDGKYGFIIKYDMPTDSSIELTPRQGNWYHSCTVMDSGVEKKGFPLDTIWENNKPRRKGYHTSITNKYDGKEITNIQARVATGQWDTAAVSDGRGTDMKPDSGFVFSKAYEEYGSTNIAVSGKWQEDQQQQIVAIYNDGGSYATSIDPGGNARFDKLKLSQIKEFRVRTRPYQWVEFRNVPLRPGLKTDTEVVVEEPAQQAGNAEKTGAKPAIVPPKDIQEKKDINIAGTIEGMMSGVIKNKYGSAMWGNKIQYTPGLYLGSLISGDKIELTDKNVIEDEFGIPVIQVKNLEQNGTTPANSIGWVHLNDTDFVDNFIANPEWLSKPKKPLTPEKMKEIEELDRAYEKTRVINEQNIATHQ